MKSPLFFLTFLPAMNLFRFGFRISWLRISDFQCRFWRTVLLASLVFAVLSLPSRTLAVIAWTNSIDTNNIVVITNAPYNAATNSSDNTAAIQSAINVAAKGAVTNGLTGGTVRIPAGVFLSGPLNLSNFVNLQLDAGAVLQMLPFGTYPGAPYFTQPANFLTGDNHHDISITGQGMIDGQGQPWWIFYNTNNALMRPVIASFQPASRVLFQNTTFSNSPSPNVVFKGNNAGNVTALGITIKAPSSHLSGTNASHNTDGIDFAETNFLVQNCFFDTGDDCLAFGSSSSVTRDILVTNCSCAAGHGFSIGSNTEGGVSNITIINCSFNGTDNPIRLKSDNNLHGSSKGGLTQNISYLNLNMTNVNYAAIMLYSYYNVVGTPNNISPATAAGESVDSGTLTPVWRNITISNVNATVANSVSTGIAGIIWGRTELPVTNIVISHVNITAQNSFDVYNAQQVQFLDSHVTTTSPSQQTFTIWNGNIIVSNTVPATNYLTFTGLGGDTNDSIALYNAFASMTSTDAFGSSPITLNASVLTNTGDFVFSSSNVMNFAPGTNAATFAVNGNLTLGGTNNFAPGNGLSNGVYTVMTYTGTLTGTLPAIGSTPANSSYAYSIVTNIPGQVNLIVTLPAPTNLVATATNLRINLHWNLDNGAASYNLKRGTSNGGPYPTVFTGLTSTNYSDAIVTNAVTYYYVVSASGAGGESPDSPPATAVPLPSNQPTNIVMQVTAGQLQLSWPQDHLGWRLEMQTNNLATGLSTNWITVPNSTNASAASIMISPTNPGVFLRLAYP